MQKVERSKIKKGYISAYGDYHRAPDGKKLPIGQYPVGLDSNAGSWRNQEINSCKGILISLKDKLNEAVLEAESGDVGRDLLADLEDAYALTSDLGESMGQIVREKLRKPLERIRGTNRRFKKDPAIIVKELKSLRKYLTLQLSLQG